MNISYENKVALVTGAGSGLGLATAKAFAEAGTSPRAIGALSRLPHSSRFTGRTNYRSTSKGRSRTV
jgi:NAD(P)-dependent dehydrogenase (short-subunit alcohol dehydrogenase family)